MTKRFNLQWKICAENQNKIIKDFLAQEKVSKKALTDIKYKGGKILVNNIEVTVRYSLKVGDKLLVVFPEEATSENLIPEDLGLEIVYEDDYLLVINKPAKMNTIPSREHPKGSVANGLLHHYEQNKIKATPHIVTRLDRDTTGLMLIAKHRHIHHLFSIQHRDRLIQRNYLALVQGILSEKICLIDKPIGRKSTSIIEREVRADGQEARTSYEVVNESKNYSLVKVQLETGRTHQIRVHFSYLGHPLLGDDLYGASQDLIERQALHCGQLCFIHPITKEKLIFSIELPKDMQKLL